MRRNDAWKTPRGLRTWSSLPSSFAATPAKVLQDEGTKRRDRQDLSDAACPLFSKRGRQRAMRIESAGVGNGWPTCAVCKSVIPSARGARRARNTPCRDGVRPPLAGTDGIADYRVRRSLAVATCGRGGLGLSTVGVSRRARLQFGHRSLSNRKSRKMFARNVSLNNLSHCICCIGKRLNYVIVSVGFCYQERLSKDCRFFKLH